MGVLIWCLVLAAVAYGGVLLQVVLPIEGLPILLVLIVGFALTISAIEKIGKDK